MTDTDPATLLPQIEKKTNGIVALKKRRDAGDFKSVNEAIELQKMERSRKQLQAKLPPLRIVT